MKRTLVVGMGNPILRDDAIGIRLARFVRSRLGDVPGLAFVDECSVGGLNVLDVVSGQDRLIVLDAIRAGGPAGGWYRFDGRALRETLNLTGVHDVNFATALELGRSIGLRVPDPADVHVFAVEVEDALTFSEHMSEALEAAFPELAAEICDQVQQLVEEPSVAAQR